MQSFSLERMVSRYAQLFASFAASAATREKTACDAASTDAGWSGDSGGTSSDRGTAY